MVQGQSLRRRLNGVVRKDSLMDSGQDPLELSTLRGEVVTLRARIVELERRLARFQESPEDAPKAASSRISLSEREELLVEAERITHMGSWVWNIEDDSVYWSDELFRILGLDPQVHTASVENFFAAVHPQDRERIRQASEEGAKAGKSQRVEYRVVRPDQTEVHVSMDSAMLFDAQGNLRRLVGTILDITERRQAAMRLAQLNAQLEEAQACAHLGTWSTDFATGLTEWSKEIYRILGLEESVGPSHTLFLSLVHPDDASTFESLSARKAGAIDWEPLDARMLRPDGSVRYVRIRPTWVRDHENALSGCRGTLLDITDITQLQRRLSYAAKMETLGRLAAGIAHDFNNVMTVIRGGLEFLTFSEPQVASDMQKAIASAENLTARLLAFGRKSSLQVRPVNPNQLVREALQLASRVLGPLITVRLELDPTAPDVLLDANLTVQSLINLLINARDAMPKGGEVILSTLVDWQSTRPSIEISVRDTGPGVAPALREQVFEPFFTTKSEGSGSGLGLSMVQGAVTQQGGTIELVPGPGGACFRMRFELEATPQDGPAQSELTNLRSFWVGT